MPKQEKTPHPRSRKADQLLKKNAQQIRKSENKVARDKKTNVLHKHCLWYHDYVKKVEEEMKQQKPNYKNAIQVKKRFTEDEMHTMIEEFLKHREERLTEKVDKKRGKTGTALQLAQMEKQEYEKGAGLRAPDLLIKDNYTKFIVWDREANSLAAVKTKVFKSPQALTTVWKNVDQNSKTNSENAAEVVAAQDKMIE